MWENKGESLHIWQFKKTQEGESVSSPTVYLEAILCTLIVYIYEENNIGTFDVHGTYLNAEIPKDKKNLMMLRGDFVDVMCKVIPD